MKFVTHKNKADVKTVDKWLTYCMVIDYELLIKGDDLVKKTQKTNIFLTK